MLEAAVQKQNFINCHKISTIYKISICYILFINAYSMQHAQITGRDPLYSFEYFDLDSNCILLKIQFIQGKERQEWVPK